MNNREELSEKCNPEKKEKGQKSKRGYEINLAIELVLPVLRQGVSRSLGTWMTIKLLSKPSFVGFFSQSTGLWKTHFFGKCN